MSRVARKVGVEMHLIICYILGKVETDLFGYNISCMVDLLIYCVDIGSFQKCPLE